MLQSIRCCAVAVLVALPAGAAAQTFEGRVTADMSGTEVVIISKDGKSRVETSASGIPMTMIMDYQSGSMTTLMPAQRMYMRMDLKQMEQAMRGMGTGDATSAPPKFTRTGRRETIAGIGCEHVVFEAKDGKQMDVCAASGMGYFGAGGSGGGPMGRGRGAPGIPAGYEQLMKEFRNGFFPLKMEMVEGTKRTQYMLVKQVERQRVDAAQFEIPAGYSEMKIPTVPPGGGRP